MLEVMPLEVMPLEVMSLEVMSLEVMGSSGQWKALSHADGGDKRL
jgi:hypothetical protein